MVPLRSVVLVQENQTRPDHLPPSQGGKYVGFGSAPPPRPSQAAPVDEVGALLSKGLQLAGVAAAQAGTVVRSGTAQVNQLLQEKQVGEVVQQTTQKAAALAQVGRVWGEVDGRAGSREGMLEEARSWATGKCWVENPEIEG